MNTQSLAERLKYYRKLNGLSQEELSNRTNVTVRTIQRIEKAEVNPHLNTVKLLATALEIEVDDLIPLKNPKEETIKKKWLLLLHATPLLGLCLPLLNILLPLFIWIHKREDNPTYYRHGVKVINFHITAFILVVLSFISLITIEKWGFFVFISTIPICICIIIFNIIYVLKKDKCFYPLSIPFLKQEEHKPMKTLGWAILALFAFNCKSPNHEVLKLDGTPIDTDSISIKIDALAKAAKIEGLAVTIFNNYKPVYQHITGLKDISNSAPLTDSTNMYGASLSKAVFSIITMKLVEDKVIALDTPLESYLPKKIYEYEPKTRWHDDYSDLKGDSLYHNITARMCLAHTTGFANWRFFEEDKVLKVHGKPGENYHYSGEGFVYLQVVIEKITGKGLEQLAQEIVFCPLDMRHTAYKWKNAFEKDYALGHNSAGKIYPKDKDNEPRSASTLETTIGDYNKFLTAVLNKKILTQQSYDELFSPQIQIHSLTQFNEGAKITTNKYDDIKLSYGLGWGYIKTPYGKGVFKGGHGSGFQHYSLLFPESGKGILFMSNSDNAESAFKELLDYIITDKYIPWEWLNYTPYH